MTDKNPNSRDHPGTQRWSTKEIDTLKRLAFGKPRAKQLRALFPGRTLGAVKVQLSKVRRELDIPKRGTTSDSRCIDVTTTMLDPDDPGVLAPHWLEAQRPTFTQANMSFLAALAAAQLARLNG